MRKFKLILLVILVVSPSIFTTAHTFFKGVDVCLFCNLVNRLPETKQTHRAPMRMPVINVSGDTINVPERLYGYEMQIVSNDVIVYSEIVSSAEMILPNVFMGDYTIKFVNDDYCFYGYICI
jgi:hypothetical protein